MCNFFSLIATKDNIYYDIMLDGHSDIIEKFKIREKTGENFNIAKIEITPPNNNVFAKLKDWTFKIDEDVIPEWLDKTAIEKKVRAILKEIKNKYILENKKIDKIFDGRYWLKNSIIEQMSGSSQVNYMSGSSQVKEMFGSSFYKKENGIYTPNKDLKIILL